MKAWDRASWAVATADGETVNFETAGSLTWAVRSLIAAGSEGLRPVDPDGKWAALVSRLRLLGVPITNLRVGRGKRRGYKLACSVSPARNPT